MSIAIMTQCWPIKLRPRLKLLLLSLADNADDDGVCWPSIATIANKCSTDERSVYRQLIDLENLGHISHESRRGRSNIYHIHPSIPLTEQPPLSTTSALTQTPATPGHSVRTTPDTIATQNHQLNLQEPSVKPKSQNRSKTTKPVLTTIPQEFAVDEKMAVWATHQGLHESSVMTETEKWFDYHKSKDSRFADWDAAWRNWIRNAVKFAKT